MMPGQNVCILLFHSYLRSLNTKYHVLFVALRLHLEVAYEKREFERTF